MSLYQRDFGKKFWKDFIVRSFYLKDDLTDEWNEEDNYPRDFGQTLREGTNTPTITTPT